MLNMSRRSLLATATAAAVFGLSKPLQIITPAQAAPLEPATGFYRFKVGSVEVTAVYDGIWRKPHDPAFIKNASVDETKQAHAAILCSLLGTILDPVRGSLGHGAPATEESPSRRLVTSTVAMLAKDPAMGGKQIAAKLDISLSRLARVFKAEMGMSLVEYRNRLRLDRFAVLLDRGRTNLLEAALAAGFGSYAQFHRVFRALRHMTPREYLHTRG